MLLKTNGCCVRRLVKTLDELEERSINLRLREVREKPENSVLTEMRWCRYYKKAANYPKNLCRERVLSYSGAITSSRIVNPVGIAKRAGSGSVR
jgi:hypothetical protein